MLRWTMASLCGLLMIGVWIPSGDPAQPLPPMGHLRAITRGLEEATVVDFAHWVRRL